MKNKSLAIKVNSIEQSRIASYAIACVLDSDIKHLKRYYSEIGADWKAGAIIYIDNGGNYVSEYTLDYLRSLKGVRIFEFSELDKAIKYLEAEKVVEVVLNKQYKAVITKECVEVGCQSFTHEAVLRVAEAINSLKDD
jgi:hypothetical protein